MHEPLSEATLGCQSKADGIESLLNRGPTGRAKGCLGFGADGHCLWTRGLEAHSHIAVRGLSASGSAEAALATAEPRQTCSLVTSPSINATSLLGVDGRERTTPPSSKHLPRASLALDRWHGAG